jgi:anti-sigma28 factor (negative regulator of flagellin synthesis)
MRIDPKLLTPIIERPTPEPAAAVRPSGNESQAAVVTLSSAGAAVAAGAPDELMSARLEQIRMLIERGEYPIDLDKLAARIADDEVLRAQVGS